MPTPFEQSYREIPLTRGHVAIVSPEDFSFLSQWKWFSSYAPNPRRFYAVRWERLESGKRVAIRMHREILGLRHDDKRLGDHRNHDTLDNRRGNLRISTKSQNNCNRKHQTNNTLGFKGVSKTPYGFRARIRIDRKTIALGTRRTPEAAYALYCEAAIRLHGEFACI